MSVIVNILAAIGLIVIIGYLIYYLYEYIVYRQNLSYTSQINPPGAYMQNSGIKCPDYWVNTGVDSNGNYTCTNSFNIATGTDTAKCTPTTLTFSPVQTGYTWDYNNPNGLTSYTDQEKYTFSTTAGAGTTSTRCDWVNKCGPSANVQGIWSGINEICNTPPVSS